MAYLLTRCAYDIYIKLPREVSFIIKLNGQEAYIKCTNRQGDFIFSYKEKDYDWIEESEDMEYTTIFGMDKDEKGTPLKHMVSPKSDVHFEGGGIIEPATYTIFEVLVDIHEKTMDKGEVDYYHKLSMDMLRVFIEKYRYVTQDNSIVIPNEDDFLIIEHLISDMREKDERGIKFKSIGLRYNYDSLLKKRKKKKVMDDKSLDTFADQLKNNKELDLHLRILMEAKEHAQIHSDYQISIIKSQTAFEVYIQHLLINLCEANQIHELKVGKHKKDYKEAIFSGNIRESLIKNYLKIFLNRSIAGTKEYNDWYKHCYEVRNSIVHRGQEHLCEGDARCAFESVYTLIQFIEKKVREK